MNATPADRGHRSGHGSRREPAGHLLADECFERGPVERGERALDAGRELRERAQIARVALDRVIGEAPLDAQVIQKGVDHDRTAEIEGRRCRL